MFCLGGFCPGFFGKGGFCPGGFCPGVYVQGVFVLEPSVISVGCNLNSSIECTIYCVKYYSFVHLYLHVTNLLIRNTVRIRPEVVSYIMRLFMKLGLCFLYLGFVVVWLLPFQSK